MAVLLSDRVWLLEEGHSCGTSHGSAGVGTMSPRVEYYYQL